MKVLIIDDSVSMRQMVSIILTGAGHEVTEAVDGTDGISKDQRGVRCGYNRLQYAQHEWN